MVDDGGLASKEMQLFKSRGPVISAFRLFRIRSVCSRTSCMFASFTGANPKVREVQSRVTHSLVTGVGDNQVPFSGIIVGEGEKSCSFADTDIAYHRFSYSP